MACSPPIPATSPDRPRALETWFLAYLVFGFTLPGLTAILLPLVVVEAGHRPFRIGAVVACQNWGLLTAPFWGWTADRFAAWRPTFAFGLGLTAAAFAGLAFERRLPLLLASGVLLGIGSGACNTVAILLVTRTARPSLWSGKLATLQWLGAVGTVAGLATAGLVGARAGMILAGLLTLPAILLACLPRTPCPEPAAAKPIHRQGHLALFAMFLLAWFLLSVSIATFSSLYPITMHRRFGVEVGPSSIVLAAATFVSLPLYGLAGRLDPVSMFASGVLGRCTALFGLAALSLAHDRNPLAALVCAALFQAVWPLLGVGSSALAATLTPPGKGAAIGLFQATGAIGSGAGALLAGSMADLYGYRNVFPAAAAVAILAVLISLLLGRLHRRAGSDPARAG